MTDSNLNTLRPFCRAICTRASAATPQRCPRLACAKAAAALKRWAAVVERFPHLKMLIANLIRGFSEPIQLDAYFQGSWRNAETSVLEPSLHESGVGVIDQTYGKQVPKCPSKTSCTLYPATSAKSSARHNCSLAD